MSKLSKLFTRASTGLDAPLVTIEVHISGGLPGFSIVGLPEGAVRESKDRVRSAIMTSQFKFPTGRITVSLAPANLPKSGARYDLPIAIGLLLASEQINPSININSFEFYGELGLDGSLRATEGLLPAIIASGQAKHCIILPNQDSNQYALVSEAIIYPCTHLLKVCEFLQGVSDVNKLTRNLADSQPIYNNDFSQVKGQHHAKRALEIAASGGHNLLLIGPPGSGKTMLAERLPSIMPPLSIDKALERASIYSVANKPLDLAQLKIRPFRSPHHSSSSVALVGGGSTPKPGEISLAHEGVLFLDELPEFPRGVLEVLRQPLENGKIHLSRAAQQTTFPANFQLIGAMNPCPCGFYGDGTAKCHCTADQINRYKNKISGSLLDRIDMVLDVPPLPKEVLLNQSTEHTQNSQTIRKRVIKAHNIQLARQGKSNDKLAPDEIEKLESLIKNLNLKTSKPNAKPNKGDRYKIRGENSINSLWIQVQQKKFFVSLSGNKKSNEHKKIYDYIGRDHDPGNIQNDHWDLDNFNEIENIVYCYAGVEKENMEQEFREWFANLNMRTSVDYLCQDLRKTIPTWDQVNHPNLFTITDVNIIQTLYKRCLQGGDLKELCKSVGNNRPSNALRRYKEFLESAELPNQGNKNMDAKLEKAISVLKYKKQIILQGSPGTGKTRLAKKIAKKLAPDNYKLIQFHPAYGYENFVRGIVATTTTDGNVSYEVQNKLLAEMAENAINKPKEDYVLIIDEINRANLSAVLGELIYALEYRGEVVESMYEYQGSRKIILPKNLYIIGTMNTADRSVGHIDYAIRRRFAFVDVNTDESVIRDDAKPLFNKVKDLFEQYLNKEEFELNDVMIGHSYFLKENLELALEYEIKPILQEYRKDGVLVDREDKIKDKIEALKIED